MLDSRVVLCYIDIMPSHRVVLLLALVAIALLAPLPSFALGRDLTPVRMATPDYIGQSFAACATEKGFLLRWSSQTRAYGTTTDAAGVPRVPASSIYPSSGKLFPNGDGYLAVSQDGIAELDAGGALRRSVTFDQPPLFISRVAFDGTNFFLLSGSVSTGFTGRLVDRNGHVLRTVNLPVPDADISGSVSDVTASPDGGFTAVVAGANLGVYAVQISATGQVTGTIVFSLPGDQKPFLVSVAANAGQTLVAWTTFGSAYVHTVALRGGSVVRDSILPATSQLSQDIALLPSGDGFILLQNAYVFAPPANQHFVLTTRLDFTGAPREATATLLNGTFAAAAATSQTLVLLSYPDQVLGSLSEVSATISDTGIAPAATYNIVSTAVQQLSPAVASDSVDFFGAWLERTSTTVSVMAGRVTRSGLPLDGTGLLVTQSASTSITRALSSPAVAFGAGVYLVVFESDLPFPNHSVMGRRYARDGTPIDPAPFLITPNGSGPSVAFGSGRFLVAWQFTDGVSLAGAPVGSDGSVGVLQMLTPPTPSQEELGSVGRPMIGWNGRHFIVAYDLTDPHSFTQRLRVLRTSTLGIPLDPHTTEAVSGGGDATIACSDQECMAGSVRVDDIVTAVVHDDGALSADAPKIVANSHRASYAAIAFDGASYILAWRTGDSLLGVARISRGGVPYALAADGTVAVNATVSYPASPPALAADSAGDTAIVTSEFSTVWLIDRARFYFASELLTPRRRATVF